LKHFTPEEFQAQNTLPLQNSKLKTLYPEEFQGSSTGGGTDIKWNSQTLNNFCINLCLDKK
jgi:hypothetical protein